MRYEWHTYEVTIGGIIKEKYFFYIDGAGGHFWKEGYSGGLLYSGDSLKAYDFVDKHLEKTKAIAENYGLTFELIVDAGRKCQRVIS